MIVQVSHIHERMHNISLVETAAAQILPMLIIHSETQRARAKQFMSNFAG